MRIEAVSIVAMGMLSVTAAHAALVISKEPSQNMTCDRGSCEATRADAVLNIKDLKKLLRGSDLTVSTGSATQDIMFDAAFAWASTRQLTLSAAGSITVEQPITVQGTGALTLQYGQGAPGVFITAKKGKVDFWDLSSIFTVNSQRYFLVADIATMANYISGDPYVHLALAKDYDAQADGVYGLAPINAYYAGHFEGLGHTIANLTITDPTTSHNDALISNGYSAFISNVGLVNANIAAADDSTVGGLVGDGNTTFENVFVTGSLSGGRFSTVGGVTGGLGGSYDCLIDASYSTASVTGGQYSYVGGLAGITNGSCIISTLTLPAKSRATAPAGWSVWMRVQRSRILTQRAQFAAPALPPAGWSARAAVSNCRSQLERCPLATAVTPAGSSVLPAGRCTTRMRPAR
jgi:hypothetical protein